MKQRVYIDTSVVGGFYDVEFQKYTRLFFGRVKNNEITVIYSDLLEKELQHAPDKVKDVIISLTSSNIEYIEISDAAIELAYQYINEKVVGKTSFEDCLHIALATTVKADILVSWNFKHIVNVERIRGYNSVNLKNGHVQIDIRSPRELINYERGN